MTPVTDVVYGSRYPWVPSVRQIRQWVAAASGARGRDACVAVRVATPGESTALNGSYRGKPYATNVLSFPADVPHGWPKGEPRPLGDLVICARVVAREAREQRKPLPAHWAHMVVHGTLHLLGYDHEADDEAARMERREKRVLKSLGFADPYRDDGRD